MIARYTEAKFIQTNGRFGKDKIGIQQAGIYKRGENSLWMAKMRQVIRKEFSKVKCVKYKV